MWIRMRKRWDRNRNRAWNRKLEPGRRLSAWVALGTLAAASAQAATVPFTESFDASVSGWENQGNAPLGFVASGGSDGGGYASGSFTITASPFGGGPVILRASAADVPSGGAFIGNWLSDGVGAVTAMVRHDAPEDLIFFLRIASAANFPGAIFAGTTSVAANVWTQISFQISVTSPLCIVEGGTCAGALGNVGNVQFGTSAPASLAGNGVNYRIDLDQVSLVPVPEPGTALLFGLGLAGLARAGRRERSA